MTTCDRCRALETECWRLSQRLQDAERRITALQYTVERLQAQLATLRRSA